MGPGHDISFGIGHSGGPPPFGLDDEWYAGLERFSDDFSDLVKNKMCCICWRGGAEPIPEEYAIHIFKPPRLT